MFNSLLGRLVSRIYFWFNLYLQEWLLSQCAAYGRQSRLYLGVRVSYPKNLFLGHHVSVGDNTFIRNGAQVLIGDYTQIAAGVVITTGHHPVGGLYRHRSENRPIRIGTNVWIGTGAVILGGVSIGDHSIVAAGAVVTNDVQPQTLVGGIPARVIKPVAFDQALFNDQSLPLKSQP